MLKYNKLFFLVLIFLAACKGTNTPDGIIKKEQMTNLLTEIHIVDGSLYNVTQMPDTLYKYGTGKYLAVFKKYHTDSIQFRKSFKYYSTEPEILQNIYVQVTKNIKEKSDSLTKANQKQIEKDNKRRTDSLKKLPKKAPAQPTVPAQPVTPNPRRNFNPSIKPTKSHVNPI